MRFLPTIIRRLTQAVPVVFGVTLAVFFLVHLLPGDPAVAVLGAHASAARIALLHKAWGLNQPLPVQYGDFMGRLIHGNLGESLFYQAPVATLIGRQLPPTLWLLGYAAVLSVLISVPAALVAAARRDRLADHVVRASAMVGIGFPAFWIGVMLLLAFGLHLGRLFPVGGYGAGVMGHLRAMFLPGLTVALGLSPILIRSLRAALLDVLESDYVTTARAKGIREGRVLVRHALPNAIISTVPVFGANIGWLVGGTLVVEQVFAIPGIGQLMIQSIFHRDFPVVQGVTLVFGILVVLVYLVTDVVHASLDPRVKLS